MTMRPAALLILLAACQTAPDAVPPATGPAMIEVANGGSMFGSSATRIYADGTVVQDSVTAGSTQHSVRQGNPKAYTAAAAVIAAEGPRTKAAMAPQPDMCMDYGTDSVRATPPVAGFDQIATACPDQAVTALMDHVLAALAP